MKFAYYPVNSVASTFPLTSDKNQDENTNNKNPVEAEEKKDDSASENPPAGEEPSGDSPAEGADGGRGGECAFPLSF